LPPWWQCRNSGSDAPVGAKTLAPNCDEEACRCPTNAGQTVWSWTDRSCRNRGGRAGIRAAALSSTEKQGSTGQGAVIACDAEATALAADAGGTASPVMALSISPVSSIQSTSCVLSISTSYRERKSSPRRPRMRVDCHSSLRKPTELRRQPHSRDRIYRRSERPPYPY
jgi:hypothetical protein